jgi:hypothetical protein
MGAFDPPTLHTNECQTDPPRPEEVSILPKYMWSSKYLHVTGGDDSLLSFRPGCCHRSGQAISPCATDWTSRYPRLKGYDLLCVRIDHYPPAKATVTKGYVGKVQGSRGEGEMCGVCGFHVGLWMGVVEGRNFRCV